MHCVPTAIALSNKLSFKLRLTALYVGLLAFLLISLGVAIYLDTRHFLLNSTAVRLRAQAKPIIDRWRGERRIDDLTLSQNTAAQDLARVLTSRDTVAVILDRTGRFLAHGQTLAEEPAPATPQYDFVARALAGENEVNHIIESGAVRSLAILIPLRPGPNNPEVVGVAQLTTPLILVDEILLEQRVLITGGIALALALGTLGGLWLTGSAIGPLKKMVATCQRIAAGDLKQRVALPERQDEIGQLADAFDNMVARLEAAFAQQGRFVADAAHELRTPLTALSGSLEVLLRGSRDDPAAANLLVHGMRRDVARLIRLAEQLLNMKELYSPETLRYQDVKLQSFLEEFAQQIRSLAGGPRIVLSVDAPITLSADPDALKQALFNLAENAIQHSGEESEIRIRAKATSSEAELRISDNGEGIQAEDLPHIFEAFYRGDRSRSRRRGGTGLGLALVQRIVETHGGRISVESELGRGSVFTLTLPLTKPALRKAV